MGNIRHKQISGVLSVVIEEFGSGFDSPGTGDDDRERFPSALRVEVEPFDGGELGGMIVHGVKKVDEFRSVVGQREEGVDHGLWDSVDGGIDKGRVAEVFLRSIDLHIQYK